MPFSTDSNFADIQEWLNEKLSQQQSIKACCEEVTKVPTSKGIYFWFMKKEGYKELSKIETIKPDKDAISKKINGTECDLVYLGTAGARNNSSGTNSGNLQERLKWHLCNNKNISSLCNGTMSTYRRTLGALLASDLIDHDLQTRLDNFLCKYFYIYYIEYPGTFKDVKNIIEKDEDILISVLRPIFNLSKNPNKENPQHTTHFIQQRRQLVERNSKEKHCNQKGSGKDVKSPLLTTKKVISAKSQEKESCIEFQVKKSENIAEVATRIRNLPNGPCSIELFSDNRIDIRLYVNGNTRLIRKNGRSVSEYFAAPDTNNGNLPKWQMVYNEMNDKKKPIESITVRVCAHSNNSLKKTSPMNPQTPIKIDDSGSTFKKPKKFKVVMICSSKKNKSFFTQFPNIRFTSNPRTVNEKFPNDKVPNSKLTWREYLTKRQHESTLLHAFKLYKRPTYLHLHTKFKKNFFILSAGWGLVSSEFKLPGYDITFSQSAPANTRRSSNINVPPLYNDFNQIEDNGDDILFLGSPDYIPLFISLTKHLKCRKIIFWKKKNTPQKYPLPNNTFKYEYYYTNSNTNWHYKLAQEL